MSTVAIIAIVVVAVIVIALVVSAANRKKREREFGNTQVEAQRDDVQHHREQAVDKRTEAAVAEEHAKRAQVEAELDEARAEQRERDLDDSR